MSLPYSHTEIAGFYRTHVPGLNMNGGEEWRGPCPIHQGTRDSFAVHAASGRWHCHSQCGRGGTLRQLAIALGVTPPAAPDLRQIETVYEYTGTDGRVLFEVVRFQPKGFRQRRPAPDGTWVWNLKGVTPVLFRLPRVLEATDVILVEGEKDVLALEALGFTATTNPMGAGKWRPAFTRTLAGKNVWVVPDKDEPGRRHALQVMGALMQAGCQVRLMELAEGKDASEFLALYGHREHIEREMSWAREITPQTLAETGRSWFGGTTPPRSSSSMSLSQLMASEIPEPVFLADGLLSEGVTLLAGRPKVGKSWLAMQLALDAAQGRAIFGRFPVRHQRTVLYLALEDTPRRTRDRVLKLMTREAAERLEHVELRYQLDPLLAGGAAQIEEAIQQSGADLVVLDTLMAVVQNSGKRDVMRSDYAEIAVLRELAAKHSTAVLVVCHSRKASAEYAVDTVAGTTGVTAACDAVWSFQRRAHGMHELQVIGREIAELTLAFRFGDANPFGWLLEENPAENKSEARREIENLLRRLGALAPAEIARHLGKTQESIRYLVYKMHADGEVVRMENGLYLLANTPNANGPVAVQLDLAA